MSPAASYRSDRTDRLAKGHNVTAVVLDRERPAVVRKVDRYKYYSSIHLYIRADEMGSCPIIAWPPQSEMYRSYVLYADWGRPSQGFVAR